MTFLGTITILLLIVLILVLFLGVPYLRRRAQLRNQQIAAEVWAADISENEKVYKVSSASKIVIRKGRLALFILGSLGFLSFLILLLFFFLGKVSLYLVAVGLILCLIFFGALRYLAVQDQKKKAALSSRLDKSVVSQVVLRPAKSVHVSRHEPLASETGGQQVKPIRHTQQKPVNYASKSLRYARLHHESPEAGVDSPEVEKEEGNTVTSEDQSNEISINLDAVLSRRRDS